MKEVMMGIIFSGLMGTIVIFFVHSLHFALGMIIGIAGAIFWIISLNFDVKRMTRSGNINTVKYGYIIRLMIGAGILGISYGISIDAFFGTCFGLMFLKIGSYISFLFSKRKGSDKDETEVIEEG